MGTDLIRRAGVAGSAAFFVALSSVASAQPGDPQPASDCPPGAYCETGEVSAPEPPDPSEPELGPPDGADAEGPEGGQQGESERTVVIPPAPPGTDADAPRVVVVHPDTEDGPGQVIVYEPGAAPPHLSGRRYEPPPPPPPPEKRYRWRRHRRWGLSLRAEGVLMPRYRDDQSGGMAGLGLALKYRPVPGFALGASADFLGGVDANGFDRQEIPLAVSAFAYPNPRSLAQFYIFGGLNWAFARVETEQYAPNLAEAGASDAYTYFGGHLGMGIEFRVSKLIGINVDGLGFVRTRTDDDADGRFPEYYDARENEGSNTSAGGMLRGGVTFWW